MVIHPSVWIMNRMVVPQFGACLSFFSVAASLIRRKKAINQSMQYCVTNHRSLIVLNTKKNNKKNNEYLREGGFSKNNLYCSSLYDSWPCHSRVPHRAFNFIQSIQSRVTIIWAVLAALYLPLWVTDWVIYDSSFRAINAAMCIWSDNLQLPCVQPPTSLQIW